MSLVIYNIYIYINDFRKANKMFNFIMYVDDTTLFSTIKSFNDNIPNKSTECAVNDELLNILKLLNINTLSLSKAKSKYMTIQMHNKAKYTLSLNINNINIERVDELLF